MTGHVRADVPRNGSLTEVGLPSLVTHIERRGLNADLVVSSGDAIKSVHFESGVIVFAKSNLIRDRLGNCLLQTGKISVQQFNAIDARMRQQRIRFGEALVAEGWMSRAEVIRHVGSHLGKIVLSLFPLEDGQYTLEEGVPTVPPELKVKLFTGQLLLFGVRRVSAQALLRYGLPGKSTPLGCVDPPPRFLETTKLQPLERAIIDAVKQGATLGSLEQDLGEDPRDIQRAIYGLLVSRVLTPVERRASVVCASPPQEPPLQTEVPKEEVTGFAVVDASPPAEASVAPKSQPETQPESQIVEEAPPPAQPSHEVDGRERQLLETVELHIAVADWRQSVPLLSELLAIAPQNARYNALLACALGKCKGMEKHAERQFQRALELAPGSANLHYEFGMFYQAMGRAGRAAQQFQEALDRDPAHKGARHAVQEIRRAQSSLGNMFKKMLR